MKNWQHNDIESSIGLLTPTPTPTTTEKAGVKKGKKERQKSIFCANEVFTIDDFPSNSTWGEVLQTCCSHSVGEWGMIAIGMAIVLFFLYFF